MVGRTRREMPDRDCKPCRETEPEDLMGRKFRPGRNVEELTQFQIFAGRYECLVTDGSGATLPDVALLPLVPVFRVPLNGERPWHRDGMASETAKDSGDKFLDVLAQDIPT